jgi:release factor glutamine methyltransferase
VDTIQTILVKHRKKIANLDLELLIAHEIKKTREFILAHPEFKLSKIQLAQLESKIYRRINTEPLAHIVGHKEFYGLDFKVNQHTLIPRPETELLIEEVLKTIPEINFAKLNLIDIGTGSGNIIISLAKNLNDAKINYFGTDISGDALKIAKYNAKKHEQEKIKFIKSNLLESILKNKKYFSVENKIILVANLPYLSKKIYSVATSNVKNFEPKSALYSSELGLNHYRKLFEQIKKQANKSNIHSVFLEFSPEQKKTLNILVKKMLPLAKIRFQKDLAGKWRLCVLNLI